MVLVIFVIISSGKGFSPVWHQAITWNGADLLSVGPLGTAWFNDMLKKNTVIFIKKNSFENLIWKMVAIL